MLFYSGIQQGFQNYLAGGIFFLVKLCKCSQLADTKITMSYILVVEYSNIIFFSRASWCPGFYEPEVTPGNHGALFGNVLQKFKRIAKAIFLKMYTRVHTAFLNCIKRIPAPIIYSFYY